MRPGVNDTPISTRTWFLTFHFLLSTERHVGWLALGSHLVSPEDCRFAMTSCTRSFSVLQV